LSYPRPGRSPPAPPRGVWNERVCRHVCPWGLRRYNVGEATIVCALVHRLLTVHGLRPSSVGVISFLAAQVGEEGLPDPCFVS
jgi:hypothetical protein